MKKGDSAAQCDSAVNKSMSAAPRRKGRSALYTVTLFYKWCNWDMHSMDLVYVTGTSQ